jgi:hypothetical protein
VALIEDWGWRARPLFTSTFSPSLMKSGLISSPVSSVAFLVTLPLAVSPRTAGSVWATVNATCCGSWILEIGLLEVTPASYPWNE